MMDSVTAQFPLAAKLAILAAGAFDVSYYLDRCIDAQVEGVLDYGSLLDHYVHKGWRLGLDPNAGFSIAACIAANPDAAAAGVEPLGFLLLREDGAGRLRQPLQVPQFEGNVDYLSTSRAIGWVWLPDRQEEAAEVTVRLGGEELAHGYADLPRPELEAAGKGTGRYGFDFTFPAVMTPGSLVVEALFDGVRQELAISNLDSTVHVPAARPPDIDQSTAAAPLALSTSSSFVINGGVDQITPVAASGWVYAPVHPEATLQVEALVDQRLIGRTIADRLRQDLLDHGVGTGRYGFRMEFTEVLPRGATPAFRVLMLTDDMLDCSVKIDEADRPELQDASLSTAANLVAAHDRFTSRGPDFEDHDPKIAAGIATDTEAPLLMAFYLPQFHTIPENDDFWGKGFTEWRQLPRALSRFPGHYQPRIPRDLGFYDLSNIEHIRRQVELAMSSGIGAFAFYYYWFNGRRVLEQPLDIFAQANFDLKFVLIWANENWTRTWDGSDSQVLLRQDYRLDDEPKLLENLAGYFVRENYLRIAGRPVFVVYNPGAIPETRRTVLRWRATLSVRYSVDPLFFMCQTFGQENPHDLGFDGAMEFPPHKISSMAFPRRTPDAYSPEFAGSVVDYDQFAAASRNAPRPDYPLIKTAVPGWDNDPRRPNRGYTLENIAPAKYEAWLANLLERSEDHTIFGRRIVAINAWNEWAECAYLEPDVHYGAAFLNATARAVRAAWDASKAEALAGGAVLKVSAIVPNYNHAAFLPERLGSLIRQTTPPDEIIFLDDCSSDDSLIVASEILEAGGIPFQIVPNMANSGGVFRQWMKGLALARNDLIWIAESDDAASPHFLERLLPAFTRPDVMAAFGRIQCIDEKGVLRQDLDGYFAELEHFAWDKPSTVSSFTAFRHDFVLRNVIPNASGAVFRRPVLTEAEIDRLYQYRFAGDWYFYALVLRGGAIAYRNRAVSMFRIGSSSASRSKFSTDRHRREHAMVLEDLAYLYGPGENALRAHIGLLSTHFPDMSSEQLVAEVMPAQVVPSEQPLRVCVAAHSFDVGGGELLPLELANALKGRGHHVTYLVIEPPNESGAKTLRPRLRADIPVVYWENVRSDIPGFLRDYGIQIFNSHNISIESNLVWAGQEVSVPYIASLHGGYENAPECVTPALIDYVGRTVSLWLYLGEKNFAMLRDAGIAPDRFERSFNALSVEAGPEESRGTIRARFGLADETVAMVLCSRAIYDKGWQVAINATKHLVKAGHSVHLFLIGNGRDLLALRAANEHLPFVTFLGHVDRPRRLFGGFDLGLFPTTYVGETFPLFLLECFQARLPVVVTDMGEIGYMMGTEDEQQPGAVVSAKLSASALARKIAKAVSELMGSPAAMKQARDSAARADDRFSMGRLVRLYEVSFRGFQSSEAYFSPD